MFEIKGEFDGKSFFMEKTLCTAEVDLSGNWRIPAIMLDMQELAEQHCQFLGFDFAALRKYNRAWVLLRMDFRFYSKPVLHQKIKLVTTCGKPRKLFHYRYFDAYDIDSGEKIFSVNSQWTIVDLEERKAVNMEIEYPGNIDETQQPFDIRRLKIKDFEYSKEKRYTPVFSDYDINRHVNNTRYMEWVINEINSEKLSTCYFKDFSMLFKTEVPMGQDVSIMTYDRAAMSGCDDSYAQDSEDFDFAVRVVGTDDEPFTYFECAGNYGSAQG